MDPLTVRWSFVRRIACASVLALAAALVAVPAAEPRFERRVAAAPGGALVIDLFAGADVAVRAGAADAVVVRASGGGTGAPVEVRRERGRIVVRSTRDAQPGARVEIEAPARFDVQVDTAGGDVEVVGVEGRVTAETAGGDLEIVDVVGAIELATEGGDVTLRGVTGECRVRSSGGDVRLDGVRGEVEASTLGGDVVAGGPSGGRYELRTTGGDIVVDDAPDGSVLVTLGGSIRVARAAGDLTAATEGGHVEALAVHGSLRASSVGGDVSAQIVGAPRSVRLEARHGDVRLTVPAALGARYDIDIAWSRASGGDYAIDSDVPLDLRRSSGREPGAGAARQFLAGRGSVGSGGTEVGIRVLNGDVTIREAR